LQTYCASIVLMVSLRAMATLYHRALRCAP
jgi:hypothetical protein